MLSATWLTQLTQALATPLKWWVIVAPWEQGLRIRGGKRAKVLWAGVHFRIPYWDRVVIQATRLRTITDGNNTFTTADGKAVTISVAVHYAVEDIEQVYEHLGTPEVTLLSRVSQILTEVITAKRSGELTASAMSQAVNAQLTKLDVPGLGQLSMAVTSIAFVRALRVMMYDYSNRTSLNNPDDREHRR